MKCVVIFKAKIKHFDEHYAQTAQKMREKALKEFNCQHFEALCEEGQEIALSYWNSLSDICRCRTHCGAAAGQSAMVRAFQCRSL
mgnify:CR=1 FL=1